MNDALVVARPVRIVVTARPRGDAHVRRAPRHRHRGERCQPIGADARPRLSLGHGRREASALTIAREGGDLVLAVVIDRNLTTTGLRRSATRLYTGGPPGVDGHVPSGSTQPPCTPIPMCRCGPVVRPVPREPQLAAAVRDHDRVPGEEAVAPSRAR